MEISSKRVLYGPGNEPQCDPHNMLPEGFREGLSASIATLQAYISKNHRTMTPAAFPPLLTPDQAREAQLGERPGRC